MATSADMQSVWGVRQIDDLVLRDATPGRLYALRDAQNITAVANTSGAVVERYAYNAFGTPKFMTDGFVAKGLSSYNWQILFAGYRFDEETGFYQVRFRYLHATLGRWLSRDPIGEVGGINLYAYVTNRPSTWIDPLGLLGRYPGDHDGECTGRRGSGNQYPPGSGTKPPDGGGGGGGSPSDNSGSNIGWLGGYTASLEVL